VFARYAYPPNALGYCGPEDHRSLLEYGSEGVVDPGIVQLARGFEGAWPYLEVIAGANGIRDPLDHRVVEAYWLGNRLLERVDVGTLGGFLEVSFRGRAGGGWSGIADAIPAGVVPHHNFHVLCVYPWVGLMRAGWSEHPLHVLDRCRIRWGRVETSAGDVAAVRFRPLSWDGRRLGLGPPAVERVRVAFDGRGFVRDLGPGDRVSMHWDWVCDRITPAQEDALRRVTLRHIRVVNRSASGSVVAPALR
jgi:hypothetical protein